MRSMTKGARRAAAAAVLLVAVGSAAACTPDPGMAPATTTTTTTSTTTTTIPTYTVPRTTLQAGSFSASVPSVNVSYLGCGGTYNPPAVTFNGPSVNIPAQTIQGAGVVTLPNVSATLAAASVNLSSFRLSCGFLSYSTGVTLEYSAVTASPSAYLTNLAKQVAHTPSLQPLLTLVPEAFSKAGITRSSRSCGAAE